MRRSISLCLIAFAVTVASAQNFGRFGYKEQSNLPDMVVNKDGIVAKYSAADVVRFDPPLPIWKPVFTSEFEQVVLTEAGPGSPSKLRVSLLLPGAAMYFENGIKLAIRSTAAPYLTWRQGSVSQDVPTPDVSWLAISFHDNQPAWIVGFPDQKANMIVHGSPGKWTIENPAFKGWLRIGLPRAIDSATTNSAASLGELAVQCEKVAPLFTRVAPICDGLNLKADSAGILAKWHFDRSGACLPPGARYAELGGYPLSIRTKTVQYPLHTEDGPIETIAGNELSIFLPVKRVPLGRSLTLGLVESPKVGTVSPFDVPSIVELAQENLLATRDLQTKRTSEEALADFIQQVNVVKEPWSNQALPYGADGGGIDVAAANALLHQSLQIGNRISLEPNALMTSIAWRIDWNTWRLAVADPLLARRAGFIAACAAALCEEPERRFQAGMLQAGLASARGLALWRQRYDKSLPDPQLIEPLLPMRQEIFGLKAPIDEDTKFGTVLFSPIKVFGDASLECVKSGDYQIRWSVVEPKSSVIQFSSNTRLEFASLENLAKLQSDSIFGMTELRYTPSLAGICVTKLSIPSWAQPLPVTIPLPRYSEPIR